MFEQSHVSAKPCSIDHMLPVFKTRAMRKAAITNFGRITPTITSAGFYKKLTGDQSAGTNVDQAEIEVDMEDVGTIADLKHLNSGHKSMYDVFWLECSKF